MTIVFTEKSISDASNWLEKDSNPARVVAQYDYVAQNSDELSFSRGTPIYLAPLGKSL